MKLTLRLFTAFGLVTVASAVFAQGPEPSKPLQEHKWLQRFVGQWETESEASMGPGQPPMKCKGLISSRMLGGFWVVNEMQGDMAGTPVIGLQTIGYDSEERKYVGTWVDSVSSHMWRYEGTVEDGGTRIVLGASGPNFMADGKTTEFRDAYEFKSVDHMTFTSAMLGEDGNWITFMTGTARRILSEEPRTKTEPGPETKAADLKTAPDALPEGIVSVGDTIECGIEHPQLLSDHLSVIESVTKVETK